jgi:thiosulfate/3-mercaptopyruvate sulfurtransferase
MKKIKTMISMLFLILFVAGSLTAQDIISAKDFAKIMKNDNIGLISARKAADFAKVHIPNAVNIEYQELNGDMKMLESASKISQIFGENGISTDQTIVLYDNGSGKYSGRLYWVFKYMGAKDVKVLDGGMKAWRAGRKPVTRNPTSIKATTFTAKVNKDYLATMTQVNSAIDNPNVILVDVRSPEEYEGTAETTLRKGHIPSSINLEYKNVLTAEGTLKSNEELAKIFNDAGITKDKEVILFCESSVRAGVVFLALKTSLNYPKVRVYDGAYLEWQSKTTNNIQSD